MKTKTIKLIFCFLILGSGTAYAQNGCDPSLWNNVYTPSRLKVLEDCKTVSGIIHDIKPDADGDYHILTQIDPGQESLDFVGDKHSINILPTGRSNRLKSS